MEFRRKYMPCWFGLALMVGFSVAHAFTYDGKFGSDDEWTGTGAFAGMGTGAVFDVNYLVADDGAGSQTIVKGRLAVHETNTGKQYFWFSHPKEFHDTSYGGADYSVGWGETFKPPDPDPITGNKGDGTDNSLKTRWDSEQFTFFLGNELLQFKFKPPDGRSELKYDGELKTEKKGGYKFDGGKKGKESGTVDNDDPTEATTGAGKTFSYYSTMDYNASLFDGNDDELPDPFDDHSPKTVALGTGDCAPLDGTLEKGTDSSHADCYALDTTDSENATSFWGSTYTGAPAPGGLIDWQFETGIEVSLPNSYFTISELAFVDGLFGSSAPVGALNTVVLASLHCSNCKLPLLSASVTPKEPDDTPSAEEPATLVLFLAALGGLALRRRKLRSAA